MRPILEAQQPLPAQVGQAHPVRGDVCHHLGDGGSPSRCQGRTLAPPFLFARK